MSFTHPDALVRDDRAGELAARDAADHLDAATSCECCGGPLGDDRSLEDGFAVGECCRRRLAAAFLPEILAAAGETRWGRAVRT